MGAELCLAHDMGGVEAYGGPLSVGMQPYGCFILRLLSWKKYLAFFTLVETNFQWDFSLLLSIQYSAHGGNSLLSFHHGFIYDIFLLLNTT